MLWERIRYFLVFCGLPILSMVFAGLAVYGQSEQISGLIMVGTIFAIVSLIASIIYLGEMMDYDYWGERIKQLEKINSVKALVRQQEVHKVRIKTADESKLINSFNEWKEETRRFKS